MTTDTRPAATGQRDRSPSFPFIPLKTAIERLVAFEDHHKRSPVSPDRVGPAWGMKPNTSQAAQTLAALKAYGLLETQRGEGGRAIVVSDDGRTYLRAQQDSIKEEVLRRAALRPKQIEAYWRDWKDDRPADAACLDALVLRGGFSPDGAEKFLSVYDATIAYAGLSDDDKIPVVAAPPLIDGEGGGADDFWLPTVKVGEYVQWISGGVDQFKPQRRVTRVDGEFAFVHGSMTGIPVAELTVIGPPAPPPVGSKQEIGKPSQTAMARDINILMLGAGRLQITAEVDKAGLSTLRQMLDKYEEILEMLELLGRPMSDFPDADTDSSKGDE